MTQIPVFSFIGYSGSGKTTFLEKLIPVLRQAGLRVAVVKHDAHGLALDREGKDSWRFAQAGAECVALVGPGQWALMERREPSLVEVLARLQDVDVILVEGFKQEGVCRIAVLSAASGLSLPEPGRFAAIVTDLPLQTETPLLPLDDAIPCAHFILQRLSQHAAE